MLSGCKLVVLDLSDNAFGPRGLVGLVDLLMSPSCFTLTTLRLNNNGLGIGGGKVNTFYSCNDAILVFVIFIVIGGLCPSVNN